MAKKKTKRKDFPNPYVHPIVERIAKRVSRVRKRRRMSKKRLCFLAGIDPKTLTAIERCSNNYSIHSLTSVLDCLRIKSLNPKKKRRDYDDFLPHIVTTSTSIRATQLP